MANKFVVTERNNPLVFRDVANKDAVVAYSFDFSPWAEEYGTITSVTWTVKAGQAAVSGQALASNVASANVTFSEAGSTTIQIKASTGTEIFVAHLEVLARDYQRQNDEYEI